MSTAPTSSVQRHSRALRIWLAITGTVVILGGLQLYILTENTAKYFAWTIKLPLSAAVLGAFYFTGAPLLYMASTQRWWPRVRALIPGMTVFVTLVLILTLIHLDQFHLTISSAPSSAKFASWVWLIAYVVEPPVIPLIYYLKQRKEPGLADPPRTAPLQPWLRSGLGIVGGAFTLAGVVLFLVPGGTLSDSWAWPLTDLTSKAIGAWFTGLGLIMLFAVRENDRWRMLVPAASYVILGILQLIAILRYSDQVDFGNPIAWIFVVLMAAAILLGAAGVAASRKAPAPAGLETAQPAYAA